MTTLVAQAPVLHSWVPLVLVIPVLAIVGVALRDFLRESKRQGILQNPED